MNYYKIDISFRTFLKALFFASAIYAILVLKSVLFVFMFAYIIASAFRPFITSLARYKIPRGVTTVAILSIFLLIVITLSLLIFDTFLIQVNTLVTELPTILENGITSINSRLPEIIKFEGNNADEILRDALATADFAESIDIKNIQDLASFLISNIASFGSRGIQFLGGTASLFFTGLLAVFIAGYMMVREKEVLSEIAIFLPKTYKDKFDRIHPKVEKIFGDWMRSQFILMILIGFITYSYLIIPTLFGLDSYQMGQFAVVFALIAGILEFFPNIGPLLTAILIGSFMVLLGDGTGVIIYVLIMQVLVQNLESIFIVPSLTKKFVHLDPIMTILGFTSGIIIGGLPGAIISIPTLAASKVILEELAKDWKKEKVEATLASAS